MSPRFLLPLGLLGAAILLAPSKASAYTPSSPRVEAMVERAIKYLSTKSHGSLGGDCLLAYTLVKSGRDERTPTVKKALDGCLSVFRDGRFEDAKRRFLPSNPEGAYGLPLMIMFLCELDHKEYREEIQSAVDELLRRQHPQGTWAYTLGRNDNSVTQYGVLAMWTAKHHGFAVPREAIGRVCNYWITSQDPKGGWGYMGEMGTSGRIPQKDVRHSMTAAGLGSCYICADMLGFSARSGDEEQDVLPPALKLRGEKDDEGGVGRVGVNRGALQRAIDDGNLWFRDNYRIDPPSYTIYYQYALERNMSFREFAEGEADPEPRWYNDGVEYLEKNQSGGNWSNGGTGEAPDTAFAVLFLTRSTKAAIAANSEGTLQGGKGLPSNEAGVRVSDGRLIVTPIARSLGELVGMLEDEDADLEGLLNEPPSISPDADPEERARFISGLRRYLSHSSFERRMVALRALSQLRDLELAPDFIYALSDPDWRVAREARNALRTVSRKFDGFGMPDRTELGERESYIKQWKDWYLTLRPDAEFVQP